MNLVSRIHLKRQAHSATAVPDSSRQVSEVHWSALTDYVVRFRPTREPVSEIKVDSD